MPLLRPGKWPSPGSCRRLVSIFCCLAPALVTLPSARAAEAPRVVASIKPLHSLVASVMAGVGEPRLLIQGAASPHSYSLRPSDARALSEAQLVFWVGAGLEPFLEKPLASLAGRARLVELTETAGMRLWPLREGGAWEPHDGHSDKDEDTHQHAGHESDHPESHDLHLWLLPANAAVIVRSAVAALSEVDPANAAIYRRNGAATEARIGTMVAEITTILTPVKEQPYLVFHDAYQYFEAAFGTRAVGAITVSPERAPGARRLREIRARIAESGAVCVFSEPQFEPAIVRSLVAGTAAKTAVLDPLGAELPASGEAYFQLMRNLATALHNCLAPAS